MHPTRFGVEPDVKHEPYDERRDATAIAVAEACVARGVPLFGICRGLQEMSVAFGCSLHPEIRELPGRVNHRMPRLENGDIHPDHNVIFADRHDVHLTPDGTFARLYGKNTIRVNSLHGQGILNLDCRVIVEGTADDGTIEAIRIADCAGLRTRGPVARRIRSAEQPGEPRSVRGVRRRGAKAQRTPPDALLCAGAAAPAIVGSSAAPTLHRYIPRRYLFVCA